ncbi:MAG TPA: hypothetical protein VG474_14860, partial [Solirubrobacteraceae bacterium]|nr:hypothetical protein [Solirubrobacteraceae bacterium]
MVTGWSYAKVNRWCLSLADGACVGVGERHEPLGDRLAGEARLDLAGDALAAFGELLEPAGSAQLGLRA